LARRWRRIESWKEWFELQQRERAVWNLLEPEEHSIILWLREGEQE